MYGCTSDDYYTLSPDIQASGCMGDTQFFFRIRCSGVGCGGSQSAYTFVQPGVQQNLVPDGAHYYGFSYFRQVKDKGNKRGYFQKSVVLITKLPYTKLFSKVMAIIAPEYFDNGEISLESACHDIERWPAPLPSHNLSLPIMGIVVEVRIPAKNDKPASVAASPPGASGPVVLPSVHETDMYRLLFPVVPFIHLLWELVLTNEPIAVMASSPTICSEIVQALVNSIIPLCYCSDYRPFFTIHDSEFKAYTTKTQEPPPVILGVTNPFFIKALQHWPHVLRLGEGVYDGKGRKASKSSGSGFYSKPMYKPYLSRDKLLLQTLSGKDTGQRRPLDAQNAILRRHLLELTHTFMIPLERYVASLMPLQRHVSPWRALPVLKPFDAEAYLKTVAHAGPQLTTGLKGDWVGLYRRFMKSPNFYGWLRSRQSEANAKLRALYVDGICKADVLFWMRDKTEVEIVDFLLKMKSLLKSTSPEYPLSSKQHQQLISQMEAMVKRLPEDLRTLLTR
ncbi:protein DENND6A-like isoform X2 [Corticium candelabrum]|uniref:protein DENND6A-like isoform X2 n=1 Tax=Corticium candelabrum TaxID=121492 RepID=UPI002E256C43|nr:protein DENND6A-like isoform X2 [Corticium candelabrum]